MGPRQVAVIPTSKSWVSGKMPRQASLGERGGGEGSRPGGEEGSRFPLHLMVGVTFSRETLLKQKAQLLTIPFRPPKYLEYYLAF